LFPISLSEPVALFPFLFFLSNPATSRTTLFLGGGEL
jgi:hypothetical protein